MLNIISTKIIIRAPCNVISGSRSFMQMPCSQELALQRWPLVDRAHGRGQRLTAQTGPRPGPNVQTLGGPGGPVLPAAGPKISTWCLDHAAVPRRSVHLWARVRGCEQGPGAAVWMLSRDRCTQWVTFACAPVGQGLASGGAEGLCSDPVAHRTILHMWSVCSLFLLHTPVTCLPCYACPWAACPGTGWHCVTCHNGSSAIMLPLTASVSPSEQQVTTGLLGRVPWGEMESQNLGESRPCEQMQTTAVRPRYNIEF